MRIQLQLQDNDTMKFLNKIDNAEMVEETADKRYVTDAEKLTWNSKSDTDTVTTINGKIGAISKADIVALGIPGDAGPIVDLGTFNDQTELITHVVMNQLPGGHYTFIMKGFPFFMLLRQWPDSYQGTFCASDAIFFYFSVSIYGEIQELKTVDLRDLMTDVGDVGIITALRAYIDSQDALKADKTYVDSKVQTDVPAGAKFTDTITSVNGQTGDIELTGDDLVYLNHDTSQYINVGNALNGLEDTVLQFLLYIIGMDYDIENDPTLKEILEMFMIVLGDYQVGVAPSLGEIVEEKANKTYVDSKVKTDVPVDAKFTDTVYTHPASHPASMITESSTRRFVTDTEKANWDTVANKVDKVAGKDLSSEDYTTEEKQKLEGIEQNANHTSNLTLNELTLGGRFKVVYNDIEDSLDIEVI